MLTVIKDYQILYVGTDQKRALEVLEKNPGSALEQIEDLDSLSALTSPPTCSSTNEEHVATNDVESILVEMVKNVSIRFEEWANQLWLTIDSYALSNDDGIETLNQLKKDYQLAVEEAERVGKNITVVLGDFLAKIGNKLIEKAREKP